MKKKVKKVDKVEAAQPEKKRGRPAGVKNNDSKRLIKIEFENFEIIGTHGDFAVRRYDSEWKYDNSSQGYVLKRKHVAISTATSKTRFCSSAYAAMKYVLDTLWDDMCEEDGEVVDSFEKLLKLTHAIVKKQEDLIELYGAKFFQFEESTTSLEDWQKQAEKKRRKETDKFLADPYKEYKK